MRIYITANFGDMSKMTRHENEKIVGDNDFKTFNLTSFPTRSDNDRKNCIQNKY